MNKNNHHNPTDEQHAHVHEDIKRLFSTAKESSLSHIEKLEGSIAFRDFMDNNPHPKAIVSPYIKNLFVSTFTFIQQKRLVYVTAIFFLILGSVAGTAYAAQNSLPGDLLYPIKINVNEKVESLVAVGPEQKALVAVKHVISRIKETEQLADENRLNQKTEESLNDNLVAQSIEVQNNIAQIEASGDVNLALHIGSDFESSLSDHQKSITKLARHHEGDNQDTLSITQKSIRDSIAVSSDQRAHIENSLAVSSEFIQTKNRAIDELVASQTRIKNIEISAQGQNQDTNDIHSQIKEASRTINEGEDKIKVGAYSNALALFKNAKQNSDTIQEKIQISSSTSKKQKIRNMADSTSKHDEVITTTTAAASSSASVLIGTSSTSTHHSNNESHHDEGVIPTPPVPVPVPVIQHTASGGLNVLK